MTVLMIGMMNVIDSIDTAGEDNFKVSADKLIK